MRVGVLLLPVPLLVAQSARADDAVNNVESLELDYRVPAECPTQESFTSAVRARTRRAEFVKHAVSVRRFVVEVEHTEGGYSGRLIVESGDDRATREARGVRCEELIDAFVFFTVLAVDPNPVSEPNTPGTSPAPKADNPQDDPSRRVSHSGPLRAALPSRPAPASGQPMRSTWHLSIGSGGYFATGIGASTLAAPDPAIDWASTGKGVVPSLRLAFLWANGRPETVGSGAFTARLRTFALSGCAIRLEIAKETALRVCALFEAGVLEIRPFLVPLPTTPNRPWLGAGALARFEVPAVPGRLFAGVDVGVVAPFEREFVYTDTHLKASVVQNFGFRFAANLLFRVF